MANLETLTIMKQIGKGGYASVLLAKDSTGKDYAIKMINKEKKQSHNISREVQAGKLLSHPNIVQYRAHVDDANNDYLIYDLVEGMDMFSYYEGVRKFNPFTEKEAKHISTQLVYALLHSHNNGVVHLDVKLDNIMINPVNHSVKLIDFGLCDFITEKNGDNFNRRVGSEEYCAPEILSTGSQAFSGIKLDVWCLGVVLYCFLSAQFPFDTKRRKAIMSVGGKHPVPRFSFPISESAKDLLTKMLETDPSKRISMAEVAAHPWMQQLA